ncbi:gamma tubulin complex Spc97/GCP2 subunit Alp4 [Polyrhizophydium stewartii]|uniref:Gamma tubulin complex Spc97/GCP2 subunit Alp4 n=1 Tax=Polyrhizophydium stewartii TaxID=2732419 RepID=A0ABR4N1W2_9FUNG|nr:Gamma-tubulin complex component 2 [Polyrhizophydium stewartii]
MTDRELRLHATVTELLAHLGIDEEPDRCLEILSKQRHGATPHKPSALGAVGAAAGPGAGAGAAGLTGIGSYPLAEQIALKAAQLSQTAPTRFMSVYEKLRTNHYRELDPLLYILSKIHADPVVAASLGLPSASTPGTADGMPPQSPGMLRRGSVQQQPASSNPTLRLRSTVSAGNLKELAQSPQPQSRFVNPLASKASLEHLLSQRPVSHTPDRRTQPQQLSKSRSALNLRAGAATADASVFSENVGDGTTLAFTPIKAVQNAAPVPHTQRRPEPVKIATLKAPLERLHPVAEEQSVHEGNTTVMLFEKSLMEQEALIIEDLLYVLMGLDGEYISRIPPPDGRPEIPSFSVDGHLEPSISELVAKILPLAGFYHLLDDFVDTHMAFKYGRVFHALGAAISTLLQEYLVLIGQLEHLAHTSPKFSLQKLWYYLSPSVETMGSLAALVAAIYEANSNAGRAQGDEYDVRHVIEPSNINRNSGLLLSILADRIISLGGNPEARKVHSYLLSQASMPYLGILHTWIFSGELEDPFNEFMIEERKNLTKDKLREDFNDVYWEQRYTLRDDSIPLFLEPWKEKILMAGKYLNVLRECGIEIPTGRDRKLTDAEGREVGLTDAARAVDGGRFAADIEHAYRFANKALIDLLVKDHKLFERLKSLKRFFLLEQSDYLTHFLDLAVKDLMQPANLTPVEKVRSLLELVIRSPSSCCSSDNYKDDVTIELSSMSLFQQLLKINSVVGLDMRKHFQNLRSGRAFDIDQSLATPPEGAMAAISGLAGPNGSLTGVEAFTLGYSVGFPLSLVINRKVLTKYQMIFRQLFLCKYIERLLSGTWLGQNRLQSKVDGRVRSFFAGKPLAGRSGASSSSASQGFAAQRGSNGGSGSSSADDLSPFGAPLLSDTSVIGRISLLRERMLHFIKMFMYYVFFDVLEPNWFAMEKQLRKASTIDEILAVHDDFLDSCLKECMLTNPKLIRVFSALITTCHGFVEFSESYARSRTTPVSGAPGGTAQPAQPAQPPGGGEAASQDMHPGEMKEGFRGTLFEHTSLSDHTALRTHEDNFLRQIQNLIDVLQVLGVTETPRLGHLLSQLDFNAYYSLLPNSAANFTSSPAVPVVKRMGLRF